MSYSNEEASMRSSIGVWILKGYLNKPDAYRMLDYFGLERYIPMDEQYLNPELAAIAIDFSYKKNPKALSIPSGYIYKGMQQCNIIAEQYDDWQQAELLALLG